MFYISQFLDAWKLIKLLQCKLEKRTNAMHGQQSEKLISIYVDQNIYHIIIRIHWLITRRQRDRAATYIRLVPVRAAARARRGRCRPRAGDRWARGRRRAMALAPGESGRYRLALARAGAPARARGGREGGEREARHWRGESAGRERRGAIWLVHVSRSDWSTCASRCN
jgi:hypothetical protein